MVCSQCLSEGHHRSQCSNPVVCRGCKQPGHRQLQCSFEAPPTSPSKTHDSGTDTVPAANATPAAQAIDQLLSSGRQATASSSMHHDNQTPTQAKITQYLSGDRDTTVSKPATTSMTATQLHANVAVLSTDTSDTHVDFRSLTVVSSSEDSLSEDEVTVHEMSDLSAESPELHKHPAKTKSAVKQKKRKQKSLQKLPKKK